MAPTRTPIAVIESADGEIEASAHKSPDGVAFCYHEPPGSTGGKVVVARAENGSDPTGQAASQLLEASQCAEVLAHRFRKSSEIVLVETHTLDDLTDFHPNYWGHCGTAIGDFEARHVGPSTE